MPHVIYLCFGGQVTGLGVCGLLRSDIHVVSLSVNTWRYVKMGGDFQRTAGW